MGALPYQHWSAAMRHLRHAPAVRTAATAATATRGSLGTEPGMVEIFRCKGTAERGSWMVIVDDQSSY